MDCEIKALAFTKRETTRFGATGKFKEETYIERILEKRRPEDSSGTPQIAERISAAIKPAQK